MAPSYSRQLLVWSLPTIAVILSYLWYKKKRIGVKSDPGDTPVAEDIKESIEPVKEIDLEKIQPPVTTTPKSYRRSLSGVESSPPIDIIIPRELRLKSKSQPIIISDEDLDLEIEKIKSMKSGIILNKPNSPQLLKSNTPSPPAVKEGSIPEENFTPIVQSPVQETIVIRKQTTPATTTLSARKNPTPPKQNPKQRKNKRDRKAAPMAQKDVAVVEDKLTSLKINTKDTPKRVEQKNAANKRERADSQRRSSERDSANNSPAEVMLASPSLSSISDNHSEKSSDSGKGGSDVATPPPPRTLEESVINQRTIYEFVIPQPLVGKLIGRQGSFVTQIRDETGAHIVARKHPTDKKLKVVSVEGTQAEIDKALKLIRDKFPLKRFSEVTLEQIHFTQQISVPLTPDHLYLKLIEGINNDTVLSCMVAPNHLFVQQPTHPTYPNLNILNSFMNMVYSEPGSPLLPDPIPENTVCAAYSVDAWYRAITLSTDPETETTYVKFLDYGGYAYVENSKLRQIRGDFLLLPFQAAECILANIRPVGGENAGWAQEAYELIAEITKGALLYTQILDYTEDGEIPLVFCYIVSSPNNPIYLNQLLVDHGYAEWIPDIANQEHQQQDEVAVLAPFEGAAGITA